MNDDGVFISYAREDSAAAQRLYNDLRQVGLNPWLDVVDLRPGEKWRPAIEHAIENSRYFLAVCSTKSVSRPGYVHKELNEALEALAQFPESDIFLIPVRLDDCSFPHRQLRSLQWVDLFPSWELGLTKLCSALLGDKERAQSVAAEISRSAETERDRALVSRLITFLEDRRVLFSQIWGVAGLATPGTVISIQEIRRRLVADLESVPRNSQLATVLGRMQEACRAFLDGYELLCLSRREPDAAQVDPIPRWSIAADGGSPLISGDTDPLVRDFREAFREELRTLADRYDLPMQRLIPNAEILARSGFNPTSDPPLFDRFLYDQIDRS